MPLISRLLIVPCRACVSDMRALFIRVQLSEWCRVFWLHDAARFVALYNPAQPAGVDSPVMRAWVHFNRSFVSGESGATTVR